MGLLKTDEIPVISIQNQGYTIKSHNLEYGFDRVFRRQFQATSIKIPNSYPHFWVLFLCDVPADQSVSMRYKQKIFELSGRCAVYVPMGILVEWDMGTGWSEWMSYVSIHPIHETVGKVPFVFHFSDYPEIATHQDALVFMTSHMRKTENENAPLKAVMPKDHERVMAYLNDHYRDIDTMAGVARFLNIPSSTLTHNFQKAYGISPLSYLHIVRIFGILLEINAGEQITTLIYKYGYKNYPTFFRQFTKVMGCSPSVFARRGFPSIGGDVDLKTIRKDFSRKCNV